MNVRRRLRFVPSLSVYLSHAAKVLIISSQLYGNVGLWRTFGLPSFFAGLSAIHPLSCTNRKKARSLSNFLRAEIAPSLHDSRNFLAWDKSNCLKNTIPWSFENA